MSGWRLRVRHHTGYQYASEVHASYNEARLTPPDTDTQSVIEARVDVRPSAALTRYRDYWGTWVHSFDINRAHRELSVSGYSVVETGKRWSPPAEPLSWSDLRSSAVQDAMVEYLGYTNYTGLDDDIRSVASAFANAPTPREAVEGVTAWIHGGMEYEKGSTTVTTTAPEALRARRGGLPGLRAPRARTRAQPRRSGSVHVGVPAPVRRCGDRREDPGREPRVDRDVAGGVDPVRPHER